MDQLQLTLKSWEDYYSKLILQYENELRQLPSGTLHMEREAISSAGIVKPVRYRRYLAGQEQYLSPTADRALIEGLARKRFIKKSLPVLRRNTELLHRFLCRYRPYVPSEITENAPGVPFSTADPTSLSGKTKPPAQPDSAGTSRLMGRSVRHTGLSDSSSAITSMDRWLREPYATNPRFPDRRLHKTVKGDFVRSKSELVIANALYASGLPYRYECLLQLGDIQLYPDFEVFCPKDSRIFYWEHFGLTGNADYMNQSEAKLRLYRQHHIVQWDNLIVTYDTPEGALDMHHVEAVIKAFLL